LELGVLPNGGQPLPQTIFEECRPPPKPVSGVRTPDDCQCLISSSWSTDTSLVVEVVNRQTDRQTPGKHYIGGGNLSWAQTCAPLPPVWDIGTHLGQLSLLSFRGQ